MKIVSSVCFVILLPIIIFALTLLTNPITPVVIKQSFKSINFYEKLAESPNPDNPETNDLIFFSLANHDTPNYLENLFNKVIDDAYTWITFRSQTPPIISLHDLANQLLLSDPELRLHIENIKRTPLSPEDAQDIWSNKKMTKDFVENNFSYSLAPIFNPLRFIYGIFVFSLPITLLMAIACIVGLIHDNKTFPAKFKWLSSTFIIAVLWAFFVLFLTQTSLTKILDFMGGIKEDILMQIAYPALHRFLSLFFDQYLRVQLLISSVLISSTIIFFLIMIFQPKKKN